MNTKKVYQNLIRCVMKFKKTFSINISKNNEKIFHNYVVHVDDSDREIKNNLLIKMLYKIANLKFDFEFEFELDFLFIFIFDVVAATVASNTKKLRKNRKNRKIKVNKFESLLTFFNVYLDFYFANMIREYKIIMNINVLINEMKHMYVF